MKVPLMARRSEGHCRHGAPGPPQSLAGAPGPSYAFPKTAEAAGWVNTGWNGGFFLTEIRLPTGLPTSDFRHHVSAGAVLGWASGRAGAGAGLSARGPSSLSVSSVSESARVRPWRAASPGGGGGPRGAGGGEQRPD